LKLISQRFFVVALGCSLLLGIAGCGGSSEEQQIIKRLNSSNATLRLKAITEAEANRSSALRKQLLRMFDDGNELPIVRGAAGMALGRLHDPRLVESALQQLPAAIASSRATNSPHQMDAFLLGKALVAYGPESMTSLAPLLKDKRREVAAWAIALHGMYRRNDQALAVLTTCVKDPDVLNRRSAVYGLAVLFHPQAEPVLARYLDDTDAEVRYHAAWGLANIGTDKSLLALERQLTREKEPHVKQELTSTIAVVKSRSGGPIPPVATKRSSH
jgi:HEAT repeat protein